MPHQEIPWKQIYDLSLQCCKYRSTKSFSVSLLREMNRALCPLMKRSCSI